MRTTAICSVMVLAVMAACNDSQAPSLRSPTAPSVVAPAGPETTGLISDTALRPLADARVEVLDGPRAGEAATTDPSGRFRFAGVFDDGTRFRASKVGHVSATVTHSTKCPLCTITIRLATERPSIDLVGRYSLTLSADDKCTDLGGNLRSRTFQATVVANGTPNTFDVSLSDPSVLPDYSRFSILVAGDYVRFGIEAGGPGIIEQVGPIEYLAIQAVGGATVPSGAGTISTTVEGYMHHCTLDPGRFSWNACGSAPGHAGCLSTTNRLTFTKR